MPYLGLARFLSSRSARITRESGRGRARGFGQAAPRQLEEWRVSYRKGADFVPRPAPAEPRRERPAPPRLNIIKKARCRGALAEILERLSGL